MQVKSKGKKNIFLGWIVVFFAEGIFDFWVRGGSNEKRSHVEKEKFWLLPDGGSPEEISPESLALFGMKSRK